jgi:hypothetical protein
MRGVLVRKSRRAGFTGDEIAAGLLGERRRDDTKTLRRCEGAVQALERAEGTSGAEVNPDPAAMQAVGYANKAFRRYREKSPFDRMVASAREKARSEGKHGKALEARTHALLFQDPRFLEVVAEAKTLAAAKDEALAVATGSAPIFSTGDPRVNRAHAEQYKGKARLARDTKKAKVSPEALEGLSPEVAAAVVEQGKEDSPRARHDGTVSLDLLCVDTLDKVRLVD